MVQREAIVVLPDGFVRLPQRGDGSLVLVRRVLLGARGFRGVDGALRLVHFLVGRFRARSREGDDEERWQAPAKRHGLHSNE